MCVCADPIKTFCYAQQQILVLHFIGIVYIFGAIFRSIFILISFALAIDAFLSPGNFSRRERFVLATGVEHLISHILNY